jgi:hypothetical protein
MSSKMNQAQRSHVFPHMWKLNLQVKCTLIIYICTLSIYTKRENKTVLVGLCGRWQEAGEGKKLLKDENIETIHIYMNII